MYEIYPKLVKKCPKKIKNGLNLLRKWPKMFQKELKWSKSRSKLVETTSEKNSCKSSDQKTQSDFVTPTKGGAQVKPASFSCAL